MDPDKKEIIRLFRENVLGKSPEYFINDRHDGKAGHWLEKAMGLETNGNNQPDILGFEMKNQTTSKTTWGDFSAHSYIWQEPASGITDRNHFLKTFGKPNKAKQGRLSWSGTPAPTFYLEVTPFGQTLDIDADGNIYINYDFSKDLRADKFSLVPFSLQRDAVTLAVWKVFTSKGKSIKEKLESKWNQKGFFRCKMKNGWYRRIEFGPPVDFDTWIKLIKTKDVFFDSGMYEGNQRPYSQWRSNNSFWDKFITEVYEFY